MKNRLLLFLSIVFLAGLFINVSAQENKGIQFHKNESWESIVALAKKENKLIFMVATPCGAVRVRRWLAMCFRKKKWEISSTLASSMCNMIWRKAMVRCFTINIKSIS